LLKHEDEVLINREDIEAHVLNYFTSIFFAQTDYVANNLPERHIPHLVTTDDNNMLTSLPSPDEIKTDVFDLNGDSAPRPDGNPGHFYHQFWHIIGNDVVKSTQHFFLHNYIMPNLNSRLIILIPKVPGADKMDNFRPIALANF